MCKRDTEKLYYNSVQTITTSVEVKYVIYVYVYKYPLLWIYNNYRLGSSHLTDIKERTC